MKTRFGVLVRGSNQLFHCPGDLFAIRAVLQQVGK